MLDIVGRSLRAPPRLSISLLRRAAQSLIDPLQPVPPPFFQAIFPGQGANLATLALSSSLYNASGSALAPIGTGFLGASPGPPPRPGSSGMGMAPSSGQGQGPYSSHASSAGLTPVSPLIKLTRMPSRALSFKVDVTPKSAAGGAGPSLMSLEGGDAEEDEDRAEVSTAAFTSALVFLPVLCEAKTPGPSSIPWGLASPPRCGFWLLLRPTV